MHPVNGEMIPKCLFSMQWPFWGKKNPLWIFCYQVFTLYFEKSSLLKLDYYNIAVCVRNLKSWFNKPKYWTLICLSHHFYAAAWLVFYSNRIVTKKSLNVSKVLKWLWQENIGVLKSSVETAEEHFSKDRTTILEMYARGAAFYIQLSRELSFCT